MNTVIDSTIPYQIKSCSHKCVHCNNCIKVDQLNKFIIKSRSIERVNLGEPEKLKIMLPSYHEVTPVFMASILMNIYMALDENREVHITSKPQLSLIKNFMGLFSEYKDKVLFRFEIGSSNNKVLKFWEPGAASFTERIECLKMVYQSGYQTSVSCEPMLDDTTVDLVKLVRPYITESIYIGLPDDLRKRVVQNDYGKDDKVISRVKKLENLFSDRYIMDLYEQLVCDENIDDPQIKWKGSIRNTILQCMYEAVES